MASRQRRTAEPAGRTCPARAGGFAGVPGGGSRGGRSRIGSGRRLGGPGTAKSGENRPWRALRGDLDGRTSGTARCAFLGIEANHHHPYYHRKGWGWLFLSPLNLVRSVQCPTSSKPPLAARETRSWVDSRLWAIVHGRPTTAEGVPAPGRIHPAPRSPRPIKFRAPENALWFNGPIALATAHVRLANCGTSRLAGKPSANVREKALCRVERSDFLPEQKPFSRDGKATDPQPQPYWTPTAPASAIGSDRTDCDGVAGRSGREGVPDKNASYRTVGPLCAHAVNRNRHRNLKGFC